MNLNREIFRLTVPAVISNITMPLLALCDTSIAGHLGSELFIGAIAVGGMMFNVIFWLFGFLRMGTTGLAAQSFGAGGLERTVPVLWRALLLAFGAGLLIVAFCIPIRQLFLTLISPEPAVAAPSARYFLICVLGAPATLSTMSIQGWLLGTQTTFLPMLVTVSVNLLNIVSSLLFVYAGGLGFDGVAYGTLLATWAGLFLAIAAAKYRLRDRSARVPMRQVTDHKALGRFFRVNTDIFFRSACIMATSMTVTAIGARLGSVTLATNQVMIQFFIFFSYFMDGFSFCGEALCGRFAGARDRENLLRSVRLLLGWSAVMAAAFLLIYLTAWRPIIALITDNREVLANVGNYRFFLFLIPPLSVLAFIYDGFFIGLTATRRMLWVTLAASLIFAAVCLVHPFGPKLIALPDNTTLLSAFLCYLTARGVLLAVQSRPVFSLAKTLPA